VRLTNLATVVLLVLGVAACDVNPTGPFEGFDGAGSGVTLTGQVVGTSTARGFKSLGEAPGALTVVVLDESGDELARVEVDNGTFTLRGLPDGSFTVEFYEGDIRRGSFVFDAVLPNQEIDITVEMDGDSVRIVEEKRTGIGHGDVELEGIARRIQTNGDPMTGSLEVDGQLVKTRNAETAIRKGNERLTLADIDSGDRVHVKGVWEDGEGGSTYVFAHEIKLQEEDTENDDDEDTDCSVISGGKVGERIVLEGDVVSGNNQSFLLDVNGNRASEPITVNFGGTPTCVGQAGKNGTCVIQPGNKVNVKGRLAACTTVDADEVKIQK
jgi:hypothetical protein